MELLFKSQDSRARLSQPKLISFTQQHFFQTFSGERLVVDHLYIQRTSPKLDCDVSRVQIHNTDPIQISH